MKKCKALFESLTFFFRNIWNDVILFPMILHKLCKSQYKMQQQK